MEDGKKNLEPTAWLTFTWVCTRVWAFESIITCRIHTFKWIWIRCACEKKSAAEQKISLSFAGPWKPCINWMMRIILQRDYRLVLRIQSPEHNLYNVFATKLQLNCTKRRTSKHAYKHTIVRWRKIVNSNIGCCFFNLFIFNTAATAAPTLWL